MENTSSEACHRRRYSSSFLCTSQNKRSFKTAHKIFCPETSACQRENISAKFPPPQHRNEGDRGTINVCARLSQITIGISAPQVFANPSVCLRQKATSVAESTSPEKELRNGSVDDTWRTGNAAAVSTSAARVHGFSRTLCRFFKKD